MRCGVQCLSLWIDPGTGQWESACAKAPAKPFEHQVPGCLRPHSGASDKAKRGGWQRLSYSTILQTEGQARFAVHVSDAKVTEPQRTNAHNHQGTDYSVLLMAGDTTIGGPQTGLDAAVVVAPVGAAWNQIVQ